MEDAPEPLITVEEDLRQEPGLEELVGEEDAAGEDPLGRELGEEPAEEEAEEDIELAEEETEGLEEEVTGDDMFDVEPSFTGRRFTMPRVELPKGEIPQASGSSGVVAIFCPEEFEDADKVAECAGRRELLSGWRPGDSGENWGRATELLGGARDRGEFGPDDQYLVGKREAERLADENRFGGVVSPQPNASDAPASVNGAEDNVLRGVEGNRPNIGPAPFEPSWGARDGSDLSQREIDELQKQLEEAERNR